MKVFISWSGERSKSIASKLRDWLPLVMQNVVPWMSAEDIRAGANWGQEIQDQLRDTTYGIICLTPENTEAPWIMFEAGALAKTVLNAAVCPYVFGLSVSDIPFGPLTQFQAKSANREGTWDLVRSVNEALGERCLDDSKLKRTFEAFWPELEKAIDELPPSPVAVPTARPDSEMLREVLETVRSLARTQIVSNSIPARHIGISTYKFRADAPYRGDVVLYEPGNSAETLPSKSLDGEPMRRCMACWELMPDRGGVPECDDCRTKADNGA